jgi:soluble lytic murein transglycosylase-like protein
MLHKITAMKLIKIKSDVQSFAAAFFLVMTLSETNAGAEIYSFVDANGVMNFSNAPADPRYKKLRLTASRVLPIKAAASSREVHRAILLHSEQNRVDPALVRAVIKAESSFNSRAVSRKGAIGLMQLMPRTAHSLNLSNPYDAHQNISGGVRHLRYLLDRFQGNVPLALAAYNAGETRVSRESRIPRIGETREYVRRVMRYYKDYRQKELATAGLLETQRRMIPVQYISSN